MYDQHHLQNLDSNSFVMLFCRDGRRVMIHHSLRFCALPAGLGGEGLQV